MASARRQGGTSRDAPSTTARFAPRIGNKAQGGEEAPRPSQGDLQASTEAAMAGVKQEPGTQQVAHVPPIASHALRARRRGGEEARVRQCGLPQAWRRRHQHRGPQAAASCSLRRKQLGPIWLHLDQAQQSCAGFGEQWRLRASDRADVDAEKRERGVELRGDEAVEVVHVDGAGQAARGEMRKAAPKALRRARLSCGRESLHHTVPLLLGRFEKRQIAAKAPMASRVALVSRDREACTR